jgi:insulysin
MAFHALEISFPIEEQTSQWKFKPAQFLSHFVGHEGPGSLMSYLKDKGWVTGLSAGPQNLGRGFAMFKCTMYLTEEGFSKFSLNLTCFSSDPRQSITRKSYLLLFNICLF